MPAAPFPEEEWKTAAVGAGNGVAARSVERVDDELGAVCATTAAGVGRA
jgi:hypothetical protein